ncbi:PLP-dependent lyase/thiolase [candidate division WWE3 bacterium]|uniref:PLP-dependent lyase/thiolase n=1 Tax=candidate division WWE3 bacterium TaxID=2053526 RepID=A0A955LGZ9_UNCKA|nr:PLP-dependent lyase/thiolase [candidate division WWE3 bacterium]
MSHSTLMIERQQIWFKREDLNTTGSIKDRGISHQLNTHLNKNEKSLVISSSGNAAISASYYAKLANAKMYVFIYPDCNPEKKNRLNELGATIMESTQPLTESLEFAERNGFTHIRQATDPEATVGYQELAAEIVDQLGLEKIDINDLALFIPVSSGTAFVGLFEGFSSLIKAKKLEKYPQMHAVQSQAVHPIAGPFDTMFKRKST